MKIEIKQKYKSLNPFISEELNELTVITGKNGSGKSQLLDLIGRLKSPNNNSIKQLEILPEINNIQFEGIVKTESTDIDYAAWKQIIDSYRNHYHNNMQESLKNLIRILILNNLEGEINKDIYNERLLITTPEYEQLIEEISSSSGFLRGGSIINREKAILKRVITEMDIRTIKVVDAICSYTGKSIDEITDADFYNLPIQEKWIDDTSLFNSKIEMVFYSYAKNRYINELQYFRKKERGVNNISLSDQEFILKFPPPWEVINEILYKHKIEFEFKEIRTEDFSEQVPYGVQIVKKDSTDIISFLVLSSGEKVIIGLILKLFTTEYYKENLKFPELIVLDEPDAHLHPEMSKLLLDILEETFVKQYNIKVIITTHSPSTVALAPEESLYELKNGKESSLKKISKDDALLLLTSFIPTLSIDYKNHRQVFCESPNDIKYYQYLYNRHIQENPLRHKLYFMSNALGEGNCDQVIAIVETLRNSGINTSYGIVDWDLENKDRGTNVFVHGKGERYSVENFVFDPIYIICSLIDIRNDNILSEIGYDKAFNQYLLGEKEENEIQRIVDVFFGIVKKKEGYESYNYADTEEIEYLNGKKIKIPKWYLTDKGHDIVKVIFNVFPPLKGYFQNNQNRIQEALTIIMTKCYPFVPLTSIKLLEEIGN